MDKSSVYQKNKIISFVCVLMIILLILPGCAMLGKITGKQTQQEEKAEKIPKQLEDIEASIEKIFTAVKGPTVNAEEEEKSQQGQDSSQALANQDNKDSTQSQDSQGSQDSQADKGSSSDQEGNKGSEASADPWQPVSKEITSLHFMWNEYMPEANKKGAKKETLEGFSDALNNLTQVTESKDKIKVMLAANNLYKNIPDLYSLYKTKISPEIKRMIYDARSSMLNSLTGDWPKAASDIEELKSSWALFKNTLEKEQQEDAAKLDLSILELEKVVKEKNQPLVDIKGKITLSNIAALEKSIKKALEEKDKKK